MLLANRCPLCYLEQSDDNLCFSCYSKLSFTVNACAKCQEMFEFPVAGVENCNKCANADLDFYSQMRCPLIYNEFIKSKLISFKNNAEFVFADIFAKFILNVASEFFENAIIIPVPLYPKRLIWRGFNQSIILAQKIVSLTNAQLIRDALIRAKDTNIIVAKTLKEREEKVHDAFRLNESYKSILKNKKIVILDDVITSGATIHNCAKALSASGISEINLVAIARRMKSAKFS